MSPNISISDTLCGNLFHNMPGMFYKCRNDEDLTMIYAGQGCYNLTGYTVEDLLFNKSISYGSMIHIDDYVWLTEKVNYNLNHKLVSNLEYRIFCREGRVKWVHEISNGVYNGNDELLFIEGYVTDITEKKQYSEIIDTLQAYQGAVNEGSIVSITDATGRIIYTNDSFCKISKYTRKELIGKNHRIVNSGYHSKEFFSDMWKTISSGKPWRAEIKNKAKDGSYYWVDSVITPVINGKKEIIQYLSVRNLVTEKKELEANQGSFRQAIDTSSDHIFMIDSRTMLFIDMNETAVTDLGYSKEEFLQMGPHDLTPEFTKEELQQKLEALINTPRRFGILETVHRKKNGELIQVEIHFTGLRPADKRHIVIASVRDITQRKKNLEDLRNSKDFQLSILSALSSSIAVIDIRGVVISINENWLKFASENSGVLSSVSPGINYLEVCKVAIKGGDHIAAQALAGINAVLEGDTEFFSLDYPCHSADAKRWFLMRVTPFKGIAGGAVISHSNITEEKLQEKAILERDQQLNEAQKIAKLGSWYLHLPEDLLEWSDETYRIFGIPPGTILKYEDFLDRVHSEDRVYVDTKWKAAMKGEPYNIVHRIQINGKIKWVKEIARLEFDEGGILKAGIGTVQDITELKVKELALANKEQELSILINNAPAIISEVSMDFVIEFANHSYAQSVGKKIFDFILPEFHEMVGNKLIEAANNNEVVTYEMQCKDPDGITRWYQSLAKKIDYGESRKCFLLISRDITNEKKFEIELFNAVVQSEEQERMRIANELHDGVCQMLAALGLGIENLKLSVETTDSNINSTFKQLHDICLQTLDDTRRISHDLMPRDLYEFGFYQSIILLVSQLNSMDKKIKCSFSAKGIQKEPENHIAISLYRIIQEFVRNTQKYGKASRIKIELNRSEKSLELFLSDNGIGFDLKMQRKEGLGLLSMATRINSIGGHYYFDSEPGKGVQLRIKVPV